MRVGSLFSGIGGLDLGLERAGHEVVFQCEIDAYRRRVLARHWPGVPCYEDVRAVARSGTEYGDRVDLLAGGFPCQDLSAAGGVAGRGRAGLAGERSGLFFEFARIADALLPDGGWVLIENVPGLLSSDGGRDFAVLLSTLAELGFHDLAWRVLDSRYLGVPQRRRRVFILARRARGRSASEVLLEPESGGGDFEAGRTAGQGTADGAEDGVAGTLGMGQQGGFRTTDLDGHGAYVASVTSKWQKGSGGPAGDEAQNLVVGEEADPDRVRTPPGPPRRVDDLAAYVFQPADKVGGQGALTIREVDVAPPVTPTDGARTTDRGLRIVDDRVGANASNPPPDGPRYAACGDAVTVNVSYWIGCRLRDFA